MMDLCRVSCSSSVQRMRTERDSLKETIEELHCVQAQEGQLTSGRRRHSGVALLLPLTLMAPCFSSRSDYLDEQRHL